MPDHRLSLAPFYFNKVMFSTACQHTANMSYLHFTSLSPRHQTVKHSLTSPLAHKLTSHSLAAYFICKHMITLSHSNRYTHTNRHTHNQSLDQCPATTFSSPVATGTFQWHHESQETTVKAQYIFFYFTLLQPPFALPKCTQTHSFSPSPA